MSRRILIIIIFLIIIFVIFVGFMVYSFLSSRSQPAQPTTQPSGAPSVPPTQATSTTLKITLVSPNPAIAYSEDNQSNIILVQPEGEIDQINASSGQQSTLLQSLNIPIISAQVSANNQNVLIQTGARQFNIYNIASSTLEPLDFLGNLDSVAFAPTSSTSSNQIAFLQNGGLYDNLGISNLAGKKAQTTILSSFAEQDYSLDWPATNTIFLSQKPSAYSGTNVLTANIANLKNASIQPIIFGGAGLMTKWLPNNQGLEFVSSGPGQGGILSLVNYGGQSVQQFNFSTLPSKCALDNQNQNLLYCAIPRDQQGFQGHTLPDDYLMRSFYTTDNLEQINLSSGQIKIIFNDTTQNYDMINLKVFGNYLFFINRYDQKLYKVQLSG